MKKYADCALRICFCYFSFIFALKANAADAFRLYFPERYDFEIGLNYYKTSTNFDAGGSTAGLASGNYLLYTDLSAEVRYVINSNVGLIAGLQITNSESDDAIATRKNSNLSYLHLGLDYLFEKGRSYLFFMELLLSYPLEKISSDTDSALNSDGAIELKPQATMVFYKEGYSPYASLGLNYRTEGLSTLLTFMLGAEIEFERMGLGGNLNGFFSILGDQKTQEERELLNHNVNAGSARFNAFNPGLIDADVYMKYYVSKDFIVKGNISYAVSGVNYAQGMRIGASVVWGFGEAKPHSSTSQAAPQIAPQATAPQPKMQAQPQPVTSKPQSSPQQVAPSATNKSQPPPKQLSQPKQPAKQQLQVTKPQASQPKQAVEKAVEKKVVSQPIKNQTKPIIRKSEEVDDEYLKNAPRDELNYIKQIEGSPKSLEKATEPDKEFEPTVKPAPSTIKTKPKSDMPEAPADYTIKLKKIKKPKKRPTQNK